jgi:hypothetical protein
VLPRLRPAVAPRDCCATGALTAPGDRNENGGCLCSFFRPSARAQILSGNEQCLLASQAVVGRFRDAFGITVEDMMYDVFDDDPLPED